MTTIERARETPKATTAATTGAPAPAVLLHGAARIAERLRRSVVAVGERGGGGGMGAGIVWRPGLVVTNQHVASADVMHVEAAWAASEPAHPEHPEHAEQPGPPEHAEPPQPFEARVIARDPRHDLALLELPASVRLPPVETRAAATLRAGELVVAVGHPWGERGAFSAGVVLTIGEPSREHAVPLAQTVRADLRLAPGNSGGPLADARGRVVGVNSMIAGGSAVAIPSEAVERLLARLDTSGRAASDAAASAGEQRPGFVGIAARAVPVPETAAPFAETAPGEGGALLLTEVVAASPAAAAGLLPGDVLLAIGEARGLQAMADALRRVAADRPLRLELLRGGRPVSVEVQPSGLRPDEPQPWRRSA